MAAGQAAARQATRASEPASEQLMRNTKPLKPAARGSFLHELRAGSDGIIFLLSALAGGWRFEHHGFGRSRCHAIGTNGWHYHRWASRKQQ